jgi:DNA-binding transcriptional LysR family regulator
MDLARVDLNLLHALHVLLEERSVRAAARRLHRSPSATSHMLGRLREALGDELLVRAGQGLVLTPRAEGMADGLAALLTSLGALIDQGRPVEPRDLRRPFRIVATDHVTTVLLPVLEPLLSAEAPGVDLYVTPLQDGTMDDLRAGRVDAAIGVFPDAPQEIRQRRLFTDGFATVARADHPRLAGRPLDLEAYLGESHLLVSPRGEPWGRVDDLLQAQGRARRIARTVPHFLSALRYVVETDLLLTISHRLVDCMAGSLPLRRWPVPLPVAPYALWLVWHPRVDGDAEQRWFRDLLTRAAAKLPPPA